MPVIWGLDLKEIQWGKFKSANMWNTAYHLRRTKFIVYQIAMILCVCSESVGTAALSDYVDQQDFIANLNDKALEYNDDFIGIASYNIFVGIYVATIFGAGFFFDLFWPERRESRGVRLAWKVCAVMAVVFAFADAIAITVIVATRSAYITGVDSSTATQLLAEYGGSPLRYASNGRALASVILLWLGFPAVVGSAILLFASHRHDDVLGPKSTHAQKDVETHPGGGLAENAATDDPAWHAARVQEGKELPGEAERKVMDRRSGATEEAAAAATAVRI